ncbi:MAG: polysaccharide biosynthesis tyrosine autokinase [Mariprofundaceae bacterium]|nr:polysaccharide biosynthesis tyrosine autokinase [Mariprofundaceae bacterium]
MAADGRNEGYEFNLEEYWHVILRRRWLILFSAFSLGIFSWLFTGLHQPPPIYASSTQVKVEQSSDLTGLLMQGLRVSSVDHIGTQLELIRSYALLERVAKRLGLIPGEFSSEQIRTHPGMMNKILQLREDVGAEQEGGSGVITISTTSDSAQFARDLAKAVAEEFRKYNIEDKNKRIYEAKAFIQSQIEVVGKRLKKAENAVQAYQQQHRAAMDPSEAVLISGVVHALEEKQRSEQIRLRDLAAMLERVNGRIGSGDWDFKAVLNNIKVSAFFDQLSQQLYEIAFKHTQLSADHTDLHPEMVELRNQGNKIIRAMQSEIERQVQLTGEQLKAIQRDWEKANQEYIGLPGQRLELARLQREVGTNSGLFGELKSKYQEALIKEAEKVEEVTILRPALLSYSRINPVQTRKSAIAGFILGLVLGLIISLILEALDTSVGSIEEVEGFLEVPVVGFIPQLSHDVALELFSNEKGEGPEGAELQRKIRLISHFSPSSTFAEAFRGMRANVMFSQSGEHRVILVTSSTIKEGKSTISANLATVIAQQGARVLLMDADLRKPMQHKTFGVNREPGLSGYLMGQMPWRDCVQRISDMMLGEFGVDEVLQTPGLDQLDLMVCGRRSGNPADLLTSPAMAQLIDEVRQEYDIVIIDMPPLLHTADASMIASKVDGVLLVYHIGAVARAVLKRVKRNIESVGGRVMGTVINGVRDEVSLDYAKFKMNRYYAYAYGQDGGEQDSWVDSINTRLTDSLSAALRWVRVSTQRRVLVIVAASLIAALVLVGIRSAMEKQGRSHISIHNTVQSQGHNGAKP